MRTILIATRCMGFSYLEVSSVTVLASSTNHVTSPTRSGSPISAIEVLFASLDASFTPPLKAARQPANPTSTSRRASDTPPQMSSQRIQDRPLWGGVGERSRLV